MALEGRVENALDERRFAAAADTSNHRHHVQRNLYIDAFQVVHASTLYDNLPVPRAMTRRNGNGVFVVQIANGIAAVVVLMFDDRTIGNSAFKHDFTAQTTRVGTHVNQVVGSSHNLFIVFHNDYGVADVSQLLQYFDESVGIARMESDARLV